MSAAEDKFKNAQRLMIEGQLKESIQEFTDVIKSGEGNEMAFLSRGVAYLKNKEIDRAIEDFSEVVKRNDHNIRAHFYKGIACMNKEDYKNAISEFDRTIQLDPNHGAAFFARGTAYAQIGNDEMATKNIKTAITFSEANLYGMQETLGLWRTQFDRAMSQVSGVKQVPEMTLTQDEYNKVKKWLEEGYKDETFH